MHPQIDIETRRETAPLPRYRFGLDRQQFYRLAPPLGYIPFVRYKVIPAGRNFFHITDEATGRVIGFRCSHHEACALARVMEKKAAG